MCNMSRKVGNTEAKAIGFQIRNTREARGMTIEQLGQKCGLHYTHVSKIERGLFKRLTDHVLNMCKLVDVPLDGSNKRLTRPSSTLDWMN